MHLVALLIGLIACAGIIVLGIRFLLQPRQATLDFGVAADNLRALTEVKGARDITSGVVLLVVLASAGRATSGARLPNRSRQKPMIVRMLADAPTDSAIGSKCRCTSPNSGLYSRLW